MSDKFTRQVLRTATVQICQNIGYTSTMVSALDVMQDVLYRIIMEFGRDVKFAAEHCNRRRPNLIDVVWTLRHCNIDFKAFHDYLTNVEAVPPVYDVPRYPVCKPEDPEYWKPRDLDEYIQQQQQQQQQQQLAIKPEEEEEAEDEQKQLEVLKNETSMVKKEEELVVEEEAAAHINMQMKFEKEEEAAANNRTDLEIEAIENDAKNTEEGELTTMDVNVENTATKGCTSVAIVPSIIYKYLNLDVPPPPTPPPVPPTPSPPPTPVAPEALSLPLAEKDALKECVNNTTTIAAIEQHDENVLIVDAPQQQLAQQQLVQQNKIKKHKKNKVLNEKLAVVEMLPITPTTTTLVENKADDKAEKKKKSLKKHLKQQQQQQQQYQQKISMEENPIEFEKYKRKQERLKQKQLKQQQKQKKLLQQQQMQLQQQQQQHENKDLFLLQQQQQKRKSNEIILDAEKFTTTTNTTTTDMLLKKPKLETEYDYYNNNNNNNNNKNEQQQMKFEVNLPNLPTGTTITPAPPIKNAQNIATTTTTTHDVTSGVLPVAIKTGKKRGRKPGSKNQPKILKTTQQQQQQMMMMYPTALQQQQQFATLAAGGICAWDKPIKLNEEQFTTTATTTLPRHLQQQFNMNYQNDTKQAKIYSDLNVGAIDLTTTTAAAAAAAANNYLQQQQQAYGPPFNAANLYPYAATARPGLIPGVANPLYYQPPQAQSQQQQQFAAQQLSTKMIPMDFLQQYKQLHEQENHNNNKNYLQQQQQLMTSIKNGDINKYLCNIPPLLPEHLKIQTQQQQQLRKPNLTPSETIDLLSDDSNEQQQQQQQLMQNHQQQQSHFLQQNNNINKKINKQEQQDMFISTSLQQQTTTPIVSKLAGGADLIPLTNTGLAYSSQNIPHTSLTAGGCQLATAASTGGGTAANAVGDITITKTNTIATPTPPPSATITTTLIKNEQQQQTQIEELSIVKKNKHNKKDKKLRKLKEGGKINKKNKKEKKEKKHKLLDKMFNNQQPPQQQQQQQNTQLYDNIVDEQQQQLQVKRDLLKKQKREKKREKQRRLLTNTIGHNLPEMIALAESTSSPKAEASGGGVIPKLTLKLGGKNSPVTTTTSKEVQQTAANLVNEQQHYTSREYSPELAKFSPLVTRPPKQKSLTSTSPPPPLVVPPPPPSSWTSGDTFPASSVLLPSQLFGACNDTPKLPATATAPTLPPTKCKDNVLASSSAIPNTDFINTFKPHSYVDEDGHMIWICPACGKVDDGSPMIGCDACDAWYHW